MSRMLSPAELIFHCDSIPSFIPVHPNELISDIRSFIVFVCQDDFYVENLTTQQLCIRGNTDNGPSWNRTNKYRSQSPVPYLLAIGLKYINTTTFTSTFPNPRIDILVFYVLSPHIDFLFYCN